MDREPLRVWETVSSTDVLEDLPWLKLSAERVRLPGGREIERFYHVGLPEYAVVVALTCEEMVVMERQYKHAVGDIVLNLPAGYLDHDEAPLAAAKRELFEETGCRAEQWYHLGSFLVDGNRGCGRVHAFVAYRAYRAAEPDNSDDMEEVEVVFKTPEEALRLLLDGEIVTSGPALALSLAFLSPISPLAGKERRQSGC